MYSETDVDIRNRENVKNNGEVFTPTPIVDSMNDLIPESAWKDPSYMFLEPTCGNGQFLVRIFEKRLKYGISIIDALNTMIGMDITKDNIWDCHKRLYTLACKAMKEQGIKPKSKEWFNMALQISVIVRNNIFLVDDSLKVMADYKEDKGELAKKRFVYEDPTGNNAVLSPSRREERLTALKKAFNFQAKNKTTHTLSSFFEVA